MVARFDLYGKAKVITRVRLCPIVLWKDIFITLYLSYWPTYTLFYGEALAKDASSIRRNFNGYRLDANIGGNRSKGW